MRAGVRRRLSDVRVRARGALQPTCRGPRPHVAAVELTPKPTGGRTHPVVRGRTLTGRASAGHAKPSTRPRVPSFRGLRPTSEAASAFGRGNKKRDTGPELLFRGALWQLGLRY